MKIKIFVLILAAVLPLNAQEFGQVGTTGAQFLKITFDPRASGLGNAAASVVRGASAIYTNAAGIESIDALDIACGYTPWFAGISMMSAVVAYRIPDAGVIGIQASGFSTSEEVTTVNQENGTGEMYAIKNQVFGISFARRITDKLVIGVQGKVIHEAYYDRSATGIAFDLGSQYDLAFNGATIGLSLQNFGPDMEAMSGSYTDYSESNLTKPFNRTPLPVMFRASFSIVPLVGESYSVRVAADIVHPNDNREHYNVGTEVVVVRCIALRGGLKFNYDSESFSLGAGIDASTILGKNIHVDYSYEDFSILSSMQKFSIGFGL